MFALCRQPSCITTRSPCAQKRYTTRLILGDIFDHTRQKVLVLRSHISYVKMDVRIGFNTFCYMVKMYFLGPSHTHWHVGEEIAAAGKEALPEARASYP